MPNEPIAVNGIMLRRTGGENNPLAQVVVEVEVGGAWYRVITELLDSNFSHIIEPDGIRQCIVEGKHARETGQEETDINYYTA